MGDVNSFNISRLRQYEKKVVRVILLVLALTCAVIAVLGGPEFWAHLTSVPLHALGILALASLAENILRIYRYRVFARALKLAVPWPWLMSYYIAGMALLPTPGKVGVALRLWLLRQHHGILYRRSTPLLVMDVLTDTLAMLALIAIGIISMSETRGAVVGVLMLAGLIGGVMVVLWNPKWAVGVIKILYKLAGMRFPRIFAGLKTTLRLIHGLLCARVLVVCTFLSLLAWSIFGFSISYLLLSMGYDIDWALGGFAVCASTILGFLTMAPAGVGGAEASMTAIFHSFGIPLSVAFIVTMLGRVLVMWVPVGIGFLMLPVALRGPQKS